MPEDIKGSSYGPRQADELTAFIEAEVVLQSASFPDACTDSILCTNDINYTLLYTNGNAIYFSVCPCTHFTANYNFKYEARIPGRMYLGINKCRGIVIPLKACQRNNPVCHLICSVPTGGDVTICLSHAPDENLNIIVNSKQKTHLGAPVMPTVYTRQATSSEH
jgi:hypothetical protein